MNKKQSKKIKEKSNELFVEWLKSLLRKEEADKVSIENYWKFLPKQSHVFANNQLWLAAYTPRWIARKLKKMLVKNPSLDIYSITLNDLKKEEKQWKQKETAPPI
mgnify:FL=1|tara:strand:+ start:165 stop:479 length:315 start_codon:yes stop_codon:yes gene_type:complete